MADASGRTDSTRRFHDETRAVSSGTPWSPLVPSPSPPFMSQVQTPIVQHYTPGGRTITAATARQPERGQGSFSCGYWPMVIHAAPPCYLLTFIPYAHVCNPPSSLMLQLLASYMETFSHVLEHQRGHMGSQLQYLSETAEALRSGEPSARIGSRRVNTSDSGGAGGAAAANGGFLGDRRMLRETLKVKFGRDHLVSTEQVKEVQLAMSQVGKLGGCYLGGLWRSDLLSASSSLGRCLRRSDA